MVLDPLRFEEHHPGDVRTIAVAHVGGTTVVLSGGARCAARAHLLEVAAQQLRCIWTADLATSCGDRSVGNDDEPMPAGDEDATAPEERVMALDGLPVDGSALLVVAATSSGSLRVWRLTLAEGGPTSAGSPAGARILLPQSAKLFSP